MIKCIARIECDGCHEEDDFDLEFSDDQETLYNLASATGWGIYHNQHLCPTCESQYRQQRS